MTTQAQSGESGAAIDTGAPAELARRFMEAFNARDLDGVRALVTEDAEFRNRTGRSFRGYDGVRDVLRAAEDAALTLARAGEESIDGGGGRVTVPVHVQLGRDRLPGTAVFEVRDGRIAAFEVIRDY